ncbi:DUF7554 family protein [Halobacterium jilantaiense]|uniref:Uncharacterized protein n=1 Tax=Halobacterium jilantaiense TaxID=355548 RepID=A0A1I0PLQ0_9EURY|nr:hypothetical protein [Halobacterium jilantaiense]SEW15269.1 hypothetical protein SAMN04487945_1787 [Halobacterium jilantaiense]
MSQARGELDADTLLRVVLVLVVVWLALEVLEAFVGALAAVLGLARPFIGLLVVALVVLWLLDEI